MRLLKTINPKNFDEKRLFGWRYRKTAKAVVFDNENKIGLLYVKNHNYYKLPGGGVEKGEDIKTALDRECKEELGVEIKVLKEIGNIVEFRAQDKLHQTSYCFLAKTNSKKNSPDFSEKERLLGYKVRWVELNKAWDLISSDRLSDDYDRKFARDRDLCFLNKVMRLI